MRTALRAILSVPVLCILVLGSAPPAHAQREPLRPAPVPNVGPNEVTPSDRAGRSDGNAVDAPFSGPPTSPVANTGQVTPNNEQGTTRQSAPAPNVSR